MCGICGVLNFENRGQSAISPQVIGAMSDAIAHRGPDDSGLSISKNGRCGLGFRRLSIIDLSPAGHQPMTTPDGRYTIVFNGEIYNHRTLRAELEEKGYRYHSQTDTETILYSYQEWGEACLEKFFGMFALAIWDENKQELFCARDRIGIKPFYYLKDANKFVFASEIKAILMHPEVSVRLNARALPQYLSLMMPPAPETMFEGIQKLDPGHSMRITAKGEVTRRRWWSVLDAEAPLNSISEHDAVEELRRLLRQSITDRMMSDVPFGVFLSGGIDSSLNVALMAELMDRPVDTFSVGFKEYEQHNELQYARAMAERFGTTHREVLIDSGDAERVISDLAWHEDEPNGDPACIPLYFVCKLAREAGVIVVQSGEGSDEEFGGYPWIIRDIRLYEKFWSRLSMMPRVLRKTAGVFASPFLKHTIAKEYLRRFIKGEEFFWGGALAFSEMHKSQLLQHYDPSVSSAPFAKKWHEEILTKYPKAPYIKRMMYVDFRHRLSEFLLMRVDKVSMQSSIEVRVPFLDHRIVEFAFRLPERITIGRAGVPKYILKKAAEGILPSEVINRKKMGFGVPMNEWMRTELKPRFESLVSSSRIVKEYLNKEYIAQLMLEQTSGKVQNGQRLWALMNLLLWEERYL